MSMQTGVVSEYTLLALLETQKGNQATESPRTHKLSHKTDSLKVDSQGCRRILLPNLCVGFGNLTATAENIPPGAEETKLPEAAEIIIRAASNCCGRMAARFQSELSVDVTKIMQKNSSSSNKTSLVLESSKTKLKNKK
ncbi:hypothetical protein GH714_038273 [Hevea brasiliensis]|uniref:Uncharacterized protein n=1 Tax=Hevea brasiliensis TaxID=3981 RepID=A0A6A6KFA7_HEVBR|nr:hypothetical protein GH714_038273 [Hevea brasiliensis]